MLALLRRSHRLVTLAALAVLSVLVVSLAVTWVTGWSLRVVETNSMEPTIVTGSVVLVRPASIHDVDVGDIVMFSSAERDGAQVLHRVVEVVPGVDELRTQGDGSPSLDRLPVPARAVEGEYVLTLERLAPLGRLLTSTAGLLSLVGGALLLLVWGELLRLAERPRPTRMATQAPERDPQAR